MDSGRVSGDSWPPGDVCECRSTRIDNPEKSNSNTIKSFIEVYKHTKLQSLKGFVTFK